MIVDAHNDLLLELVLSRERKELAATSSFAPATAASSTPTGCRGSRRAAWASRSVRSTRAARRTPRRANVGARGRVPAAVDENAERVSRVRSRRSSTTRVCGGARDGGRRAARGRPRGVRGVVRARSPLGEPHLEPPKRVRRGNRDARAGADGRRPHARPPLRRAWRRPRPRARVGADLARRHRRRVPFSVTHAGCRESSTIRATSPTGSSRRLPNATACSA